MKLQKTFLVIFLLSFTFAFSQNLHDDVNAAFPSNLLVTDSNNTNGWTSPGSSTINSISTTPQNGLYALQLISTSTTDIDRVVEYTFDAVVSETYNIRIWVREGDANNSGDNRPEFSNWSDVSGFTTTIITTGTVWTEYNFTVTATSTAPIIRIYAHTALGTIGDSVDIDNVLITNSTADTTPPSTITDLASASVDETTLTLNWTAATDNVGVVDYGVFKDGVLESMTSNSNTYNVVGLSPSTSYDFTVYSIDAANNISLVSNTLNETTVDTTAPSTITDLSSASVTETTLTLNWTAATDNVAVTDYEVFQDEYFTLGLTGGANTLNINGLTPNTAYSYTVFAKDAAGNTSLVSNTHNISTLADTTAPTAITDLSSSNVGETTLTLNWTAATDNVAVTDYEVFQDAVSLGLTGGPNTFNVTGLTLGNSYDFTVYAKDAAGNTSLVSNTLNETTVDTTAPSTITDLSSASVTETTLTLNWTAATDNVAVTDYEVFQDAVSLGLTGGPNTFNVTGLTTNTTYNFTVFAKDAAGNTSLVSNTLNQTTLADTTPPTPPLNLFASNTTAFTTTLNWTISQSIDVTGYRIYQIGVGLVGTTTTETIYDIEELEEQTFYSFYVTAIDAENNESDPSNSIGINTPEENGAIFYSNLNSNLISVDWTTKDLFALGNVGIGTTPDANYKLAVDGNMVAEEVRVALKANWPDYVFAKDYKLPTLREVEEHINKYGHLMNIPSAKEVESDGISIGEMNSKLLRKIEELTLYIIDQEKKIEQLSNENKELLLLKNKVSEIEKALKNKE